MRGLPPETELDEIALDDESAVAQESLDADMEPEDRLEDFSPMVVCGLSIFWFRLPRIEVGRRFRPGS